MIKESRVQLINDLIVTLNEKRIKENKVTVSRQWTGLGHWLKTNEPNYKTVGRIYTSNDLFIGFLEGLLWSE
ncbi:MAG: hypothetical protein PHY56_07905 [Candidatus Omnitrophica bacterium]|nr:hypothetical protein [Candidatus Omnitrophota bacterium]